MKVKGFTLIETVIYIALLSILMSGTLVAVYQILQSSSATSAHDAIGMEGNFVLRKVAWMMGGAESITAPTLAHPSGSTLSIVTYDSATVSIKVNSASKVIEMSEGGAYEPVTTSAVTDPAATFKRIQNAGGVAGIEATVTLSGKTFYFKKYLPK